MGVLERAQASWESRPTHEIEVPEWGEPGKPLVVFFKAPNMATMSRISKESKGDLIEQAARLVAACSMDEKGDRLFQPADAKTFMHHVDPAVIARIAARIMEETNVSVEDAEKNSVAIQA